MIKDVITVLNKGENPEWDPKGNNKIISPKCYGFDEYPYPEH